MKIQSHRSWLELTGIALALIGFWLIVAVFNASDFYRRAIASGGPAPWFETILFQMSSALNWAFFTPAIVFVAERFTLRRPRFVRNLLVLAIVSPAFSLARAAFGGWVSEVSEGGPVRWWFIEYSVQRRFWSYLLIVWIIIGVVHLLELVRDAEARQQREFVLQAAVANAEIDQLRARLQPQFMFATLQEIGKRIRSDPAVADDMLVGLGDVLRRGLDYDRRREVTLGEELDFVDRFLELIRHGARPDLTSRFAIDEELLDVPVPAMVLQSLVESVASNRGARHVEIEGRRDGASLHLVVRAPGCSASPCRETFDELRFRVRQRFGESCALTYQPGSNGCVTDITLPIHEPEELAG